MSFGGPDASSQSRTGGSNLVSNDEAEHLEGSILLDGGSVQTQLLLGATLIADHQHGVPMDCIRRITGRLAFVPDAHERQRLAFRGREQARENVVALLPQLSPHVRKRQV